jgi:hypothetical protein
MKKLQSLLFSLMVLIFSASWSQVRSLAKEEIKTKLAVEMKKQISSAVTALATRNDISEDKKPFEKQKYEALANPVSDLAEALSRNQTTFTDIDQKIKDVCQALVTIVKNGNIGVSGTQDEMSAFENKIIGTWFVSNPQNAGKVISKVNTIDEPGYCPFIFFRYQTDINSFSSKSDPEKAMATHNANSDNLAKLFIAHVEDFLSTPNIYGTLGVMKTFPEFLEVCSSHPDKFFAIAKQSEFLYTNEPKFNNLIKKPKGELVLNVIRQEKDVHTLFTQYLESKVSLNDLSNFALTKLPQYSNKKPEE